MKTWKVQRFLGDIVWDMRQRNLLPIVALLVVAMVVLPVLVGGGSEDGSNVPVAPLAGVQDSPETAPAVLAYDSGVRDYHRRLRELTASDPFKQQFRNGGAEASALADASIPTPTPTAAASSPGTTGTDSTATGGSTGSSGSTGTDTSGTGTTDGGSGGGTVKEAPRYVSYRTNAKAGNTVGALESFVDVPRLSFLPGSDKPVVLYLGVADKGKAALFLISSEVSSSSGQGTCVSGDPCSILRLLPGQTQTFEYADGATYAVHLLSIKRVVSTTPDAS